MEGPMLEDVTKGSSGRDFEGRVDGLTDELMDRALDAFTRRGELAAILEDANEAFNEADDEFRRRVKDLRRHADTYVLS
jgi:hypothetical protein